jgi:hypothetical protein
VIGDGSLADIVNRVLFLDLAHRDILELSGQVDRFYANVRRYRAVIGLAQDGHREHRPILAAHDVVGAGDFRGQCIGRLGAEVDNMVADILHGFTGRLGGRYLRSFTAPAACGNEAG